MPLPNGAQCKVCGTRTGVAAVLGICGACLRTRPDAHPDVPAGAHARSRAAFGLPGFPPRTPGGVRCLACANECQIGEGEGGYYGLRTVHQGRLVHLAGTPSRGMLHWYRDPLPTNCVADWVCEGRRHPGCHNLAVFHASCTADCLFCCEIPYALLAFAPSFEMSDLPCTSLEHARAAEAAAVAAGLVHVRVGNRHLLSVEDGLVL